MRMFLGLPSEDEYFYLFALLNRELVFVHFSLDSIENNNLEQQQAKHLDFSGFGRAGAEKRHKPMRDLKQYTINLYKSHGKMLSANRAAYELKDRIIAYGKTIKAHLSEENAQRTIAKWFRESKSPSSG